MRGADLNTKDMNYGAALTHAVQQ